MKTFAELNFPGTADRRRGPGRLGQVHADLSAQALAGSRGHQGLFQRVELLGAGEVRHEQGQKARAAHADDVQPHSRDGFRRPLRTASAAAVAGRLRRPVRPLYFHRVRARRGARLPARMGARHLQFRGPARPDVFLQGGSGSVAQPHSGRPAEVEIFRGGHGFAAVDRSLRKLPHFSGPHFGAIPGDERGIQFHRDGRQPARGKAAGARAQTGGRAH